MHDLLFGEYCFWDRINNLSFRTLKTLRLTRFQLILRLYSFYYLMWKSNTDGHFILFFCVWRVLLLQRGEKHSCWEMNGGAFTLSLSLFSKIPGENLHLQTSFLLWKANSENVPSVHPPTRESWEARILNNHHALVWPKYFKMFWAFSSYTTL